MRCNISITSCMGHRKDSPGATVSFPASTPSLGSHLGLSGCPWASPTCDQGSDLSFPWLWLLSPCFREETLPDTWYLAPRWCFQARFGGLFFIYPQLLAGDQPSFSSCERTAQRTSAAGIFLVSSSLQGGKGHSSAKIWNTLALISPISWSFTFASTQRKAIHAHRGTTSLPAAPFSRRRRGRCPRTSHLL